METRNILDWQGNIVGQMSLPTGTSEAEWESRLAPYALPPKSLEQVIAEKMAEIEAATSDYLHARITEESQLAYTSLMLMAYIDNKPNRLAYIRQLWDWTQEVLAYNIASLVAVSQMTDINEVLGFGFDVETNVSPMPSVDLMTAIQIND